MHSFRGPVWGAVATLLIATGIAATVRAGSVLDGPTRRDVTGKPDAQMDTLDYHLIDRADVPKKKKLDGDPSLRKQLEALDLGKSKNDFQKLKENKPEPGLDTSQWIPSWMGTTGGLDLPWAYSLAKGAWVVGLAAKERNADARYWQQVYSSFSGSDRGLTVNYGLLDGVEIGADLDHEDRTFTYAPQADLSNPAAPATSARFRGNPTLAGVGIKGTVKMDELQFAIGFHGANVRNIDRNVIEFHDYDRLNNVYAVASTREGQKLQGHFSARYVTYDWGSSISPSGATTSAPGFIVGDGRWRRGFGPGHSRNGFPVFQIVDSTRADNGSFVQDPPAGVKVVQVGKGASDWIDLGFGIDYEPSRNLRLIGEMNWESGINFIGSEDWYVNVGARYSRANWAGTFGMRHVNSRGYREPILSVAYRF